MKCWICGKDLPPGLKKQCHVACERGWSHGYRPIDTCQDPKSRPGEGALDVITRQEHGRGIDHWDEPWGMVRGGTVETRD